MGTMSLNCRKTWLAAWLLLVLMAAPAWSQGVADAQLFAPYQMDQFGGGPRANEGAFFTFDYMRWTIQKPDITTIGFEGLTRQVYYTPDRWTIQSNTNDTGFLKSDWTDGQRFEFGDVSGHHGWIFGAYRLHEQYQRDAYTQMDMTVQDLEYGDPPHKHLEGYVYDVTYDGDTVTWTNPTLEDLPLSFDDVTIENWVEHWGVECMYLYRMHPNQHGGILELYLGARYMEFNERFWVDARGERFVFSSQDPPNPIEPRSVLADSTWMTNADNRIVGPQIGMRYFKTTGRWTFSTEGRFLAGFNSQTVRQNGTLGSQLDEPWPRTTMHPDLTSDLVGTPPYLPYVPATMQPSSFKHSWHDDEFTPTVELRLEAKYQLTRAFGVRAGWDVMWMNNIARPSNMINYTLGQNSLFGIRKYEQDVLLQGWTLGFEFNR
jgi:hypothetical protein